MMNKNIKDEFPFFLNNKEVTYLDSAASSLKLNSVIKRLTDYYVNNGTNIHRGVYKLSHEATEAFEATRVNVAKLINSKTEEVIFTKGTTDSLNKLAFSLSSLINEGDEIITSELEHHSSLLPWQEIARLKNAKLVYVPLNDEGRITVDNFKKVINNNTKIVALTHVSNALGFLTPIKEIVKEVRKYNAYVILDAAQSISHMKIDVKDLDIDFLAFSAHKMYGPNGVGVLYGKDHLLRKIPPFEFGGEMAHLVNKDISTYKDIPHKFEAGTPVIGEVIAFNEAVLFFLNNDMEKHYKNELLLKEYLVNELLKIDDIIIYNKTAESPIITLNIKDIHPHDAASILDEYNVYVRAGHHCAQLVNKHLEVVSTLRVSIGIYNNKEDVERFVFAIKKAIEFFKQFG
ncbi:MAG TPA: cysteine desulfurase [Acholeplasma sp.]|nr:cysteine desulfurase [Acholeplasma sp.]